MVRSVVERGIDFGVLSWTRMDCAMSHGTGDPFVQTPSLKLVDITAGISGSGWAAIEGKPKATNAMWFKVHSLFRMDASVEAAFLYSVGDWILLYEVCIR